MNICLWVFSASIVKPPVGDGAGSQSQKEAPPEPRRDTSGGRADVAVPKTLELLSLSVSSRKEEMGCNRPSSSCLHAGGFLSLTTMNGRVLLGSHVSIAGGLHTAFARGRSVGCTTMQIFTKNTNRWESRPLESAEIAEFKSAEKDSGIVPVVVHAAYLINLCAVRPRILQKSREAYADELRRSEQLGCLGVVVHPGSHMGAGAAAGIARIAESLNIVHEKTKGFRTLTILETTAGQGTSIGHRFEELREILDGVEERARIAVCLDTCHLFAAGYHVNSEEGWDTTLRECDNLLGLSRIAAVHVNDSRKGFGSRLDRHEHIGKGLIGETGFRFVMNDGRFAGVPKILETDKSEDLHEDLENISFLRGLINPEGTTPG